MKFLQLLIFLTCIFGILDSVYCQKVKIKEEVIIKGSIKDKKVSKSANKSAGNEFSRWVISPVLSPAISLLSIQKDENDNKIPIEENDRFLMGMRIEKYFPNTAKGYGVEIDYHAHSMIFSPNEQRYGLYENIAGLSAFYSLKKGKYAASFHPNLEFGIRNEFVINSKLTYATTDLQGRENLNGISRFYRLWGMLGVGWKKDIFNQTPSIFNDKKTKAGLSSFQLRFYLPVFNQGNPFKDSDATFPSNVDLFRKNTSFNIFCTFSYTQNLDWKNNIASQYKIPSELAEALENNKSDILLAPLVNTNIPRTSFLGNFTISYEAVSPNMDSVFSVVQNDTTVYTIGRSYFSSNSFKFGYSLHFGNHEKFVSDSGEPIYKKGFSYDIFANASYLLQNYRLRNLSPVQLQYHSLALSAGFKFGYMPTGIYFTAGYTYRIPLAKKLLINENSYEEFNFSNLRNQTFFVGIGMRNNIYIILNYYQGLENLKVEKNFFDNVGISVGFGI